MMVSIQRRLSPLYWMQCARVSKMCVNGARILLTFCRWKESLEAEEVSQDTYPTTPSIALQAFNLKGRSESQLCNSTDTPVLFKGKQ